MVLALGPSLKEVSAVSSALFPARQASRTSTYRGGLSLDPSRLVGRTSFLTGCGGRKCQPRCAPRFEVRGGCDWALCGGLSRTCRDPRFRAKRGGVGRLTLLVERALPVGMLVMAVVGAPVLIFAPQGLPRLRGLQKELADVDEENAAMRREIDSLRGRVTRLRDDPGAVERMARDHLGLVRQSEVVFQFQTRR